MADERLNQDAGRDRLRLYDQFVHEHEQDVYTYVLRMVGNKEDAADLTQDALIQAYKTWSQVDPGSSGGYLKWTYRIAHNLCIDFKRKKRPQTVEGEVLAGSTDERSLSPEEVYEHRVTQAEVREALLSLPEIYREVLLFRLQSEFSYEQIADFLEVPLTTVETRIHRAKQMLRNKLKRFK